MSTSEDEDEHLTPGARRILEVASELFYWRGIHAVGVDTIAAESGVTKRTLYNRFGSKDRLVVAYLQTRDRHWRHRISAGLDAQPVGAVERVLVPFDVLPEWLTHSGRGCSFVNAFAEIPERDHHGHQMIVAEKQWLRSLFHQLLIDAGITRPDDLALQLLNLHEGAITSHAVADEPTAANAARSAAETLILHATAPQSR